MKRLKDKAHGQRIKVKERGKAKRTVTYAGDLTLSTHAGGEMPPAVIVYDAGEQRAIPLDTIDTIEEA